MSDLTDLHRIRERLEAAENGYNADVLVDLMAEDVVLMVPDFPVQEGRKACARFVRDVTAFFRETARRHITYTSGEVRIIGEVAYDRGTFSFTFKSRDGLENVVETGKYFWLYKRAPGGGWQIWRTIVSLDQREDDD